MVNEAETGGKRAGFAHSAAMGASGVAALPSLQGANPINETEVLARPIRGPAFVSADSTAQLNETDESGCYSIFGCWAADMACNLGDDDAPPSRKTYVVLVRLSSFRQRKSLAAWSQSMAAVCNGASRTNLMD
jgi:hypothetical protein